jgi:hypothetical protein
MLSPKALPNEHSIHSMLSQQFLLCSSPQLLKSDFCLEHKNENKNEKEKQIINKVGPKIKIKLK